MNPDVFRFLYIINYTEIIKKADNKYNFLLSALLALRAKFVRRPKLYYQQYGF